VKPYFEMAFQPIIKAQEDDSVLTREKTGSKFCGTVPLNKTQERTKGTK
jgi:hypothetical protein